MKRIARFMLVWVIAALALAPLGRAQDAPKPFSKEELEQLAAPIALYPDALVAQILMAATYPLEVVSAARWSKANPNVKDKALEDAMQKQPWEASVKSLTAFPQVLAMMNEKLDMTQKLGDAFLGQQKDVMAAIQRLRAKADKAGNLKSSKEQTVTTVQESGQTVIKIEPADPQVVYVPTYNPAVVYGPWPYPAYPPYYYYPPGYVPGAAFFTFTAGVIIGSALWGGCNWGGGGVYINHNTYNNFNKTNIKSGDWQHRPENRKGVQYRDQASQQKFGGGQRAGVDSREQFRGRAEQGRQDIARDREGVGRDVSTADRARGADRGAGVPDRAGGAGDRAGVGDRSAGVGDRTGGAGDRAGTRQAGGFDGIGSGGQTRSASSRGASSRASAGASRGGGGRRR
ncbi:MAG TPA: DUF3300 domain-containing protein [Burkholderiales bacterium]|nr:DUF3300 domain-containing protein [Burkholderiales bacterium]